MHTYFFPPLKLLLNLRELNLGRRGFLKLKVVRLLPF